MKKLFVSVLAIAAAVACNTAEIVDLPQNPQINFANAFVQNATRADVAADPSTKTADLASFNVWGFMDEAAGQVFVEELVTKSGDAWGYTNTQYWVKGHVYYFAALANYTNAIVDTAGANTYGLGTVAFDNAAAAGAEDLLYAATSVDATNAIPESPVALTFSHLLSKVKFSFTNGFANPLATIDVKNVQITNAPAVGTINLAVENWWDNNDWAVTGSTTLNFGDVCEKLAIGGKQECANECLTIPAAQDYVIEFDVVYYQGSVKATEAHKVVTLKDVEFQMGKAYNLAAVIDASNVSEDGEELKPIEFTVVEVKDWVTAQTPDAQVKDAELRAAAQFGGKLTLSEDIALQSTLVVTSDLVLDLGGHTLTNKLENAATDVIIVAEGATLTIEGDGTVEAVTGNDGYAVIAEGTVIINGGTFKSGVDANGEPNAVVYARGNGEVYVNGGYFPNDNESKFVLNKKDADRETTVIEVKGGEFGCFNPANNAAENAGTNFVAEGHIVCVNAAGNYVVIPFYGEVALTEDLKLTSTLSVTKDLTLDLNGHNLTIANDSAELGEGDGIIVTAGTLTIKGEGTVTANTRAIWARGNGGAVINIEGGHYVGATKGNTCEVIYASGNGKINIYGGTFEAETEDNVSFAAPQYAVLNLHGNGATGCDIVVYGGSFKNFNPADNISENPKHNFVAEGCVVYAQGDYYVVADAIAVATAAELQAALDCEEYAELKIALVADIEGNVTANQKANINVTLNGNGHKFNGTLYINGHNRIGEAETLTIKNVHFYTEQTSALDFIWCADSNNGTIRYAHNITIDGCEFTAPEATDVVGMRFKQAYDLVVKNCVMNGGHSLVQNTSMTNQTFENLTIVAGRGINLQTSSLNTKVVNCNIKATKADGYGVRVDAGATSELTVSGSTIEGYEPIVLRNAKAAYVFNFENSKLISNGEYQVVVAGETPVMNGVTGLVIKK